MGSSANGNGNGSGRKLKIAMYCAGGCGGCDISLLEIGPKLLDLVQLADVAFWPCAADAKYADVAAFADGTIDICCMNGAIRSSEHEEVARLLRRKSRTLVAYGECAVDGGIPALANLTTRREIFRAAYLDNPSLDNPDGTLPHHLSQSPYGDLEIPELYPQVLRLSDVVPVDYRIPGCPPQAARVWDAVVALATGAAPAHADHAKVACTDKSVCDECKLEKKLVRIGGFRRPHQAIPEPSWCLLEQGFVCMGPATRGGCGALCTSARLPCRGCYGAAGKASDQGMAMLGALGSILDAQTEERAHELVEQIVDPTGTLFRFTMAASDLKARASGEGGER